MKTYSGHITKLEPNQVFVFGSNLNGFHGAGSAGFASFGVAGNQWRQFNYSNKPNGWKGKWNIKGVGEGFQEGTEGKSYALPTVTRAGDKNSFSKAEITISVQKLYEFARKNQTLEFLIAYRDDGSRLLNGYSIQDMSDIFSSMPIPENVVFEDNFFKMVKKL